MNPPITRYASVSRLGVVFVDRSLESRNTRKARKVFVSFADVRAFRVSNCRRRTARVF